MYPINTGFPMMVPMMYDMSGMPMMMPQNTDMMQMQMMGQNPLMMNMMPINKNIENNNNNDNDKNQQ